MTELMQPDPTALETLACDLHLRPAGAPSFHDLAPALRELRREEGALVAVYDPAAAEALRGLVAAEQRCCGSIDWRLEGTTLSVRAAPAQLDLLAQLIPMR